MNVNVDSQKFDTVHDLSVAILTLKSTAIAQGMHPDNFKDVFVEVGHVYGNGGLWVTLVRNDEDAHDPYWTIVIERRLK